MANIERLLPADEQALLKAYVEWTCGPPATAAIYDILGAPVMYLGNTAASKAGAIISFGGNQSGHSFMRLMRSQGIPALGGFATEWI